MGPGEFARRLRGLIGMEALRKRWGVLAVVAVMVGLPAVALASRHFLHGPVGSGANNAGLEIHLKARHDQVKVIYLFGFFNIPFSCTGGSPTAVSGKFPKRITVSGGKFSSTQKVNSGRTTYTATGTFSGLNKASGTLRIHGTVPGCLSGDTGVLHWHAAH